MSQSASSNDSPRVQLPIFTPSILPNPAGFTDCAIVLVQPNGTRTGYLSDGVNWNPLSGSSAFSGLTGVPNDNAALAASLAAKAPFGSYALGAGSTNITAAAHGNRFGYCNQAAATTQTFANAATSGAGDGMAFACLNKGAGVMTAAGAITAGVGFKLTARRGEALLATFDAAADAWVSETPDYNVVQPNEIVANYTTTILDVGRDIRHPASDNNARTVTIDSQANVPTADGACIGFINRSVAALTIAVTTQGLRLVGAGTTGSRALAQYGEAVAKYDATAGEWFISGINLS